MMPAGGIGMPLEARRTVQLVAICAALGAGCNWFGSDSGSPGVDGTPAGTPVVHVPVPELFIDPVAEPEEGPAPLSVQFDPNVEDNLGPVVECEWDFGDGSPKVKELKPKHVFEKTGDYEVTVSCRDAEGLTGESEVDVFVD
jgi:PKD repeat protein